MNSTQLKEFLDLASTPYSDVSVYLDHKEIFRHASGYTDKGRNIRPDGSELFFLYSSSKVMTCTAAMQLVERGLLSLDDPVKKYLPEYADITFTHNGTVKPCDTVMTVRHLFSMCGGLDYDLGAPAIRELKAASGDLANTRETVAQFVKKPLLFQPGEHYNYSLCHDVIGAIIEVVSGKSFGDYMRENIWGPLGLRDTCFFPNEKQQERIVAQYRYENGSFVSVPKTCAFRLTKNYESGGAGIVSSVNDYILFADAMACGGVGANGARIISPETIDLMRTPQLSPTCFRDFTTACANKPGYTYALGVRSHIDAAASESKSPIGEFGWDGAAGTYVLIDPENRLSIFYSQHVLGHPAAYDVIHPFVRNAAYDIAGISAGK